MPSIWEQITSNPETYTDGYGTEREVYEPGFIRLARRVYNAADNFLNGPSDEEYMQYGFHKPIGGAGILDLMSPESAAKLLKAGEAAKKVDEAKKAARLRQADIINNAEEIKIGKSGRARFRTKTEGSGKYEKVDLTPLSPEEIAIRNATISAQNAAELGAPDLSLRFIQEARRLKRK